MNPRDVETRAAHWAIVRGWAEPHYLRSFGLMPAGDSGPVSSLQPQQPAPGGVGDSFRTASDVHLGEDRFPVRLDRAFANEEG
jgi:hypothetical protein